MVKVKNIDSEEIGKEEYALMGDEKSLPHSMRSIRRIGERIHFLIPFYLQESNPSLVPKKLQKLAKGGKRKRVLSLERPDASRNVFISILWKKREEGREGRSRKKGKNVSGEDSQEVHPPGREACAVSSTPKGGAKARDGAMERKQKRRGKRPWTCSKDEAPLYRWKKREPCLLLSPGRRDDTRRRREGKKNPDIKRDEKKTNISTSKKRCSRKREKKKHLEGDEHYHIRRSVRINPGIYQEGKFCL